MTVTDTTPAFVTRTRRVFAAWKPQPKADSNVYASNGVASVSSGLRRDRIEQVLVLNGSTSSALATLLANLEEIAEAVPMADNHIEALLDLRAQAFRMGQS